jgi:hypothetical protein
MKTMKLTSKTPKASRKAKRIAAVTDGQLDQAMKVAGVPAEAGSFQEVKPSTPEMNTVAGKPAPKLCPVCGAEIPRRYRICDPCLEARRKARAKARTSTPATVVDAPAQA